MIPSKLLGGGIGMRSIEELKEAKNRRRFEPFHIHLADGRDLRITHPDAVAWDADSPRRIVAIHESGFDFVDLTLITSIQVPHPEAAPDTAT
jgi:hypothetical protein